MKFLIDNFYCFFRDTKVQNIPDVSERYRDFIRGEKREKTSNKNTNPYKRKKPLRNAKRLFR